MWPNGSTQEYLKDSVFFPHKLANPFKETVRKGHDFCLRNCWILGKFWEQTTVYQKKEGHSHGTRRNSGSSIQEKKLAHVLPD